MRGTVAFLDNVGAVSMYSVHTGLADAGAKGANRIALFPQLLDSQTLVVTANTSTLYAYTYTDLAHDGPTVIEIPPGMLGFLDDAWQRFVGNMGVTGPDKGKGGKYLVLPPGYTGKVPRGLFPAQAADEPKFPVPARLDQERAEACGREHHLEAQGLSAEGRCQAGPDRICRHVRQGLQHGLPQRLQLFRGPQRRSSRTNRSTPSVPRCAVRSQPSASSRASLSSPMHA